MAKFYGEVGYIDTVESAPGVWTPSVIKKLYSGDILKDTSRWRATENVNDDLVIQNRISILADPYAYQHFHNIRFVKWMGTSWKVTSVAVERPRLILTIGGVYNGDES